MQIELKSLRAVNCGPLKDVCIDFTDATTGAPLSVALIAGANGSGKTTVLELIAALAEMLRPQYSASYYDGQIEYLGQREEFSERTFGFLKRADYAQADIIVDGEVVSLFCGKPPSDNILADNYFGRNSLERSRPDQERSKGQIVEILRYAIHRAQKDALAQDQPKPQEDEDISTPPSLLFLPHIRFLAALEGRQVSREDTSYQWVYRYVNALEFEGSLNSYLIWLEYAEPEKFAQVQQFLGGLYPDGKKFDVERKRLKAVVHLQNGQTHDVEQLSSGEQNLLILLLELRRRLLPGSIVLIDEIENSLHPAFQHRIAQGLLQIQRETPYQLIVTSHAEAFIDVFGTKAARILPMIPRGIK